ncbi:MAG: hypothetical protein C4541_03145 [Candidatus Auribacter fodinae]|uniref:Uncharacterized protein n=1 Tax=Candidatus Auribacter fodinae TaxID=2093366 RepID=A0A3A4R7H9_9BACT|nr:MAG: hypothetical protein C4541_03145 [Candidatus Auribacter fodinae]
MDVTVITYKAPIKNTDITENLELATLICEILFGETTTTLATYYKHVIEKNTLAIYTKDLIGNYFARLVYGLLTIDFTPNYLTLIGRNDYTSFLNSLHKTEEVEKNDCER